MWSDNESSLDLLGFQHLADGVVALVMNESLLPVTVGVFGDWGSGKTTLFKIVQAELEKDDATLVLSFNGWLFEGYEDAKTALMGSIIDALSSNRTLNEKAAGLASRLLKRVNWLRVIGVGAKHALAFAVAGPVGLGISAGADFATAAKDIATGIGKNFSAEEAQKYLKEDTGQEVLRGVRDFRKDFGELLAETGLKRLVVMIDDLDRCRPDTIIETLEAIKLFLFVPNTAFVLGADERLIKYAVRRRFPELELPGERIEVGRDYLEKLVQFPVRIPPLSHTEIETYINLLFTSISGGLAAGKFEEARKEVVNAHAGALHTVNFNHGVAQKIFGVVPPELAENLAIAHRLAPILTNGLSGNPRQCKRFLNTLIVRSRMAKSRKVVLHQRVLAKLMLLEYFKTEWFKRLSVIQAEQDGKPTQLAQMEQIASPKPTSKQATNKPGAKAESKGAKSTPVEPAETPAALTGEFQSWISDPWTKDWLASEPRLSDVDLRPYFFFSRDVLGPLGASVLRLSPAAQDALNGLLGESDAVRTNTLKAAAKLSPIDAIAILESLIARAERSDDLGDEKSSLWRAFDWVGARSELCGQFATALDRLPDHLIPMAAAPRLAKLAKGLSSEPHARQLLDRWSKSENKNLATAAAAALRAPAK